MRLLALTSDLPYPPTWGAAIRNQQFLKGLASRHQVLLLTYADRHQAADARELEGTTGIAVRTVPWQAQERKRLTQLRSVFGQASHLGGIFHQPAMQAAIDEALAGGRFDAILLEGSLLGRFEFPPGVPVVLDEHNIEYEMLARTYQSERSPVRKAFGFVEYRKFRREERAAWRRASHVVFTSERECEAMRRDGAAAPTSAVPNGVDLDYLRPAPAPAERTNILFTGRIDYRPNTDAVLWFCRDVLPMIHSERPDAVFTVVGSSVPREVRRLAEPRIDITGHVPDVRPYWRRAAVTVAPIRFGGGTRLKVVEAMAAGRPVVSTSLGCEGIDAVPGEHLLVGDTPREFADAVIRLLAEPELAGALAARGRALVEERYGWPGLAWRLEAVLQSVLRDPATPAEPVAGSAAPVGR
jgi:polysaccharide biosynthesis protein PslH